MNQLRKGCVAQISRKRKQREEEDPLPLFRVNVNKSGSIIIDNNKPAPAPAPAPTPADQLVPSSGNRILAGYMAYEFLTKGTLMGQKFDPARAEAVPVSSAVETRMKPPSGGGRTDAKMETVSASAKEMYAEVAALLKTEGAHIPGIVNPTQLSRWIQM